MCLYSVTGLCKEKLIIECMIDGEDKCVIDHVANWYSGFISACVSNFKLACKLAGWQAVIDVCHMAVQWSQWTGFFISPI